jgi:hypothetical protein
VSRLARWLPLSPGARSHTATEQLTCLLGGLLCFMEGGPGSLGYVYILIHMLGLEYEIVKLLRLCCCVLCRMTGTGLG